MSSRVANAILSPHAEFLRRKYSSFDVVGRLLPWDWADENGLVPNAREVIKNAVMPIRGRRLAYIEEQSGPGWNFAFIADDAKEIFFQDLTKMLAGMDKGMSLESEVVNEWRQRSIDLQNKYTAQNQQRENAIKNWTTALRWAKEETPGTRWGLPNIPFWGQGNWCDWLYPWIRQYRLRTQALNVLEAHYDWSTGVLKNSPLWELIDVAMPEHYFTNDTYRFVEAPMAATPVEAFGGLVHMNHKYAQLFDKPMVPLFCDVQLGGDPTGKDKPVPDDIVAQVMMHESEWIWWTDGRPLDKTTPMYKRLEIVDTYVPPRITAAYAAIERPITITTPPGPAMAMIPKPPGPPPVA